MCGGEIRSHKILIQECIVPLSKVGEVLGQDNGNSFNLFFRRLLAWEAQLFDNMKNELQSFQVSHNCLDSLRWNWGLGVSSLLNLLTVDGNQCFPDICGGILGLLELNFLYG